MQGDVKRSWRNQVILIKIFIYYFDFFKLSLLELQIEIFASNDVLFGLRNANISFQLYEIILPR